MSDKDCSPYQIFIHGTAAPKVAVEEQYLGRMFSIWAPTTKAHEANKQQHMMALMFFPLPTSLAESCSYSLLFTIMIQMICGCVIQPMHCSTCVRGFTLTGHYCAVRLETCITPEQDKSAPSNTWFCLR